MTDQTKAPERIWASTGLYYDYVTDWSEGSWLLDDDTGGVECTRADLSDALVRAALEAAAKYHDEIYEHDMSGIEYSALVGIPISNRADLEQSCKLAEIDAKAIRAIAADPEAVAAIVAQVMEVK